MNSNDGPTPGDTADPFTKFWTDMMTAAPATSAAAAFAPSQEESLKQMRRAFLGAWAKSCDEFMHSERFLEMMKRSMDSSLAFREQMNTFLSGALQDSAFPSRDDTDSILQAVRTLDERVVGRIEELSRRVETLEGGPQQSTASQTPSSPGAKGGTP